MTIYHVVIFPLTVHTWGWVFEMPVRKTRSARKRQMQRWMWMVVRVTLEQQNLKVRMVSSMRPKVCWKRSGSEPIRPD